MVPAVYLPRRLPSTNVASWFHSFLLFLVSSTHDVLSSLSVNVAPTAVSLSSLLYVPPTTVGAVVGVLSCVDANSVDSFTYTLLSATPTIFQISGAQLLINTAGVKGNGFTVTVRCSDQGALTAQSTFTLNEANVAPTNVALSAFFYTPPGTLNGFFRFFVVSPFSPSSSLFSRKSPSISCHWHVDGIRCEHC